MSSLYIMQRKRVYILFLAYIHAAEKQRAGARECRNTYKNNVPEPFMCSTFEFRTLFIHNTSQGEHTEGYV
jgi:hypothetical protein